MSERVRTRERFKLSTAVFLLMINDGKLLLLLRDNTGWFDGHYSLPGGVKEPKENLALAVVREAQEEIGSTISPKDVSLVHTMHNFTTGQEWIGLFFATQKWTRKPKVMEPHKHSQLAWVPLHELPVNMTPYIQQAIELYTKGVSYSEFGWEVPESSDEVGYVEHYNNSNNKKKKKEV